MWPPTAGGGDARAFECRRQYQAMLAALDARVGALEDALAAAGLWQDTLVTLMTDNGGVIEMTESAGNNFPLRGGKYAAWEVRPRAAEGARARGRPLTPPPTRAAFARRRFGRAARCPRARAARRRAR